MFDEPLEQPNDVQPDVQEPPEAAPNPPVEDEELPPEAAEPGQDELPEEDELADDEAEAAADEETEDEEDTAKPAKDLPPELAALCKAAIEALLFTAAEPVTTRKLADALRDTGIDGRGVRKLVLELAKEYDESRRGVAIEEVAGGFQMMSRPDFAEYVARMQGGSSSARLSQAALETLAVVAYKQPVTRADVEAIRGVQAGPLLRTLLQKNLVRITGRAEILGRPLLYGTTKKFLEYFGLKSLNELPKVEELPKP